VEGIRDKIFKEVFGFTRMRNDLKTRVLQIIEHVIVAQKTFDYQYYVNKSCPMPANWKVRKAELIAEAAKGGEARGKVYRELFEAGNTQYTQVADFLTEFVANVFPKDFMGGGGKNRKVFTKKVLQFVKFNRFENFSRVTLLSKFRP
jgi:hypothetical protein